VGVFLGKYSGFLGRMFCGEVVYFGGGEVMALGRGVGLYSWEVRRRITGKCGQFCGEVDVFLGEA